MDTSHGLVKNVFWIVFLASITNSSGEGCSTTARNCGECLTSTCGWCADPEYTNAPRCDMTSNLSNCSDIRVQDTSMVKVERNEPLRKKIRSRPQKVAVSLAKGDPVILPLEVKIPKKISSQNTLSFSIKKNPKYKVKLGFVKNWKNESGIPDGHFTVARYSGKYDNKLRMYRLVPGTTVKLEVRLESKQCSKDKSMLRIKIKSIKKSTMKISVTNPGCPCTCQDEEETASLCEYDGYYKCGDCTCSVLSSEKMCKEAEEPAVDMRCVETFSDENIECSGKGECRNGYCVCNDEYSGRYCECDDFSCPFYNDTLCGGNGECRCGICECRPGYTGEDCGCETTVDNCLASNGMICGGQGECICGSCICDENSMYAGPKCEECKDMAVKSERCNYNGDYECGGCKCYSGYQGNQCELGDEQACINPNFDTNEVCSGQGDCDNGQCSCDTLHWFTSDTYTGRYCECDHRLCPHSNDILCGGNGECICGMCQCYAGFTGESCDCITSVDNCTSSNGMICGGHGICECGQCVCEESSMYVGPTCDQCADADIYEHSPMCNNKGDYKCGECSCKGGYSGQWCEEEPQPEMNAECVAPNSTSGLECNGRGECIEGMCMCSPRRSNSALKYSGKFCECDDFSCSYSNGQICGGRGECSCGKCICHDGYIGEACDCPTSNTTCIADNGKICNNVGTCTCGACYCDPKSSFKGPMCEECPTCPGSCWLLKECVLCSLATSDEHDSACANDPCSANSFKDGRSIDIHMVDEINPNEQLCQFSDNDSCRFLFSHTVLAPGQWRVNVQRERVCPQY